MPSHPRETYSVGIICALALERAAVAATLDEEHDEMQPKPGDANVYTFGRIGRHNVVVAPLPTSVTGKVSAMAGAKDLSHSFPIKAGFMVGIGGGVWSQTADVRLGDVIVSQPDAQYGGVVQWNFGKTEKDGIFHQTGSLNKPPLPLLTAVQYLSSKHLMEESRCQNFLKGMMSEYPRMEARYKFPGRESDEL